MKKLFLTILLSVLCVLPVRAAEPPKELTDIGYLHDVVWHLYRWYLDESDGDRLAGKDKVDFWVCGAAPRLDPGDKSRFGEIIIPALNMDITLKKADYEIPETGLAVHNDRFKIVSVARPAPAQKPKECAVVKTDYRTLKEAAGGKPELARFPDEAIMRLFNVSAAAALRDYLQGGERPDGAALGKGPQALYLAPLLEISNETWAFWENGRMLLRFSSDTDLENPSVWSGGGVSSRLYDIRLKTVISLDEVAGSNAYLTRDQVGRALFNCMALGRRVEINLTEGAEK